MVIPSVTHSTVPFLCSRKRSDQYKATRLPPCVTYWEIKGVSISYHVYVVWVVKEPLSLKCSTGFLYHLIINIILHLCIVINKLQRDVNKIQLNSTKPLLWLVRVLFHFAHTYTLCHTGEKYTFAYFHQSYIIVCFKPCYSI